MFLAMVIIGGCFLASFAYASFPSPRGMTIPRLTVSSSIMMPIDDIVLGSSSLVDVGAFVFTSGSPLTVRTLTFVNCIVETTDTDGDCADAGETPGSDAAITGLRLVYTRSDGAHVTASVGLIDGVAYFTGLDMSVSPYATTATLLVDTDAVSATGSSSGDQFQLNLVADSTHAFSAYSSVTGKSMTESDLRFYIPGATMTLRETQPTFSLSASSPSGLAVPGFAEVLRFSVAADPHGDVGLHSLLFKVTAIGSEWNTCAAFADEDAWDLYEYADTFSLVEDIAFYNEDGTRCSADPSAVLGYVKITLIDDLFLLAGERTIFSLDADTSSAAVDDMLRIDIAKQEQAEEIGLRTSVAWTDDDVLVNDASHLPGLTLRGKTLFY